MYQSLNVGFALGGVLAILLGWGDLVSMISVARSASAPGSRRMPMPSLAPREQWIPGEWVGYYRDEGPWLLRLRTDGTFEGLMEGHYFWGTWEVGATSGWCDHEYALRDAVVLDVAPQSPRPSDWGWLDLPINDAKQTIGEPAFRRVR